MRRREVSMKNTKQDVADCMNRLYERGLTTTSGGNISVRHGADAILLTPSATDKGRMKAEEIAVIGLDGTNRTPDLKPSIETSMHLEIYRRCADVQAIVHAHPPRASAFAAARRAVNTRLIAESYARPGFHCRRLPRRIDRMRSDGEPWRPLHRTQSARSFRPPRSARKRGGNRTGRRPPRRRRGTRGCPPARNRCPDGPGRLMERAAAGHVLRCRQFSEAPSRNTGSINTVRGVSGRPGVLLYRE